MVGVLRHVLISRVLALCVRQGGKGWVNAFGVRFGAAQVIDEFPLGIWTTAERLEFPILIWV